ncbi:MAG: ATP phosphoribosyltransferase regulatory subunit [Clostridium butyricum]|nr:ATP phosphoribosyltransferase regulatory subunit [Clostridium butyricum]
MSKKNVLPEGTRDLILDECVIKRSIERDIDGMFEAWGYKEVITPTVEFYETFNNSSQSLNEEDMYKFFDNTGKILVLRPDMTIPIARVVQTKLKDAEIPLRLRYISNVFRVHQSFGGKRNEFTDCGVELIGLEHNKSDLEVLVLALEALKKLELNNFKLEIGNIGFLKGVLNNIDITKEQKETIAQFIEDKNIKSLEEYLGELNIDDGYKRFLNKLPWMFGDKSILNDAKNLAFNADILSNIKYLETLYYELEKLGYGENVTFDLGMAPRLNYYTGIIFRGYGEGVGNTLLRGGRYDKLIPLGDGKYMPSIGFSIDINSVISVIKNKKYSNRKTCRIYYKDEDKIKAIKESMKIRNEGYIVELLPKDDVYEMKIVKND